MTDEKPDALDRAIRRIGWSLVILPVVVNEWSLRPLSLAGRLSKSQGMVVAAFDLALLFLGVLALAIPGRILGGLRTWAHRAPRSLAFGLGFILVCGLVVVLEMACLFLNHHRARVSETAPGWERVVLGGGPFQLHDDVLGFRPRPGARAELVQGPGDRDPKHVFYTIAGQGRRVTPLPAGPPRGAVVFLGCSFVFGDFVDDALTLPAQFARQVPDRHVYNYGFSGYGPQHALLLVRSGRLEKEVEERPATGVYVFIDDHVRRLLVSMNVHNRWGVEMPYLEVDDAGQVEFRGLFSEARPLLAKLWTLLGSSQVLRYTGVDLPPIGDTQVERTARVLAATAGAFRARFPGGRFVVVLYPYPGARVTEPLASGLGRAGVEVLDLSGVKEASSPEWLLSGDGHPSPTAYFAVAELIARRLQTEAPPPGARH